MTFFSSFPALGSDLLSFLSKGFANSTLGLTGVGVVGLGDVSRLALRGVDAGVDENLELRLLIQLDLLPPLALWFLTSFRGPLLFAPAALAVAPLFSPLRRLDRIGRLDSDLACSAADALGTVVVVVELTFFGSLTSVALGKKAAFSVVGVGGTTSTGGGGACGVLDGVCVLEGAFSAGFFSAGVLCLRRSTLLNQISPWSSWCIHIMIESHIPLEFNRNSKSGDPVSLDGARSWFVDKASGDDMLSSVSSRGWCN